MASRPAADRAEGAPRDAWSDEHIEELMGRLLRAGVVTAATLALVGGLLYLHRHGGEPAAYRLFRGEPVGFRSVHGIIAEAARGSSRGIIAVGLLALIATPIARVIFSLVAFLHQRDWIYVGITAFVLSVLAFSLLR